MLAVSSCWTGFWESIQWTPRSKQVLPLCRLHPTFHTYHLEAVSISLSEVSRERRSVSASRDPLRSCNPLPKAVKPVWTLWLTGLPCLVVYGKVQFLVNVTWSVTLNIGVVISENTSCFPTQPWFLSCYIIGNYGAIHNSWWIFSLKLNLKKTVKKPLNCVGNFHNV